MNIKSFRPYPTILLGFVWGPLRRETKGGSDWYDGSKSCHLLIDEKPLVAGQNTFQVSHIQKKSLFGFLLTWPFDFHFYISFKKQTSYEDNEGVTQWVPGSEKVFYVRSPGFRWEAGSGNYILTKGYIGLHWD